MTNKRIDKEELIFQYSILTHHDIDSCRSTAKVDMFDHIDLFLGNGTSVDVKRQKKINIYDTTYSTTHTWIELKNVRGNPGWLYGKATHIAFALNDHYIVVDRLSMVEWMENILHKYKLVTDGKYNISVRKKSYLPYKIYTRNRPDNNTHDRNILVEISELKRLNHVILKRDASKLSKKS